MSWCKTRRWWQCADHLSGNHPEVKHRQTLRLQNPALAQLEDQIDMRLVVELIVKTDNMRVAQRRKHANLVLDSLSLLVQRTRCAAKLHNPRAKLHLKRLRLNKVDRREAALPDQTQESVSFSAKINYVK
jgi:hypothetical protein